MRSVSRVLQLAQWQHRPTVCLKMGHGSVLVFTGKYTSPKSQETLDFWMHKEEKNKYPEGVTKQKGI